MPDFSDYRNTILIIANGEKKMITKMMDCDLLVLGAGGSGLVAANRAYDLTGGKVVVLEKTRKPAGCTYFASGMGESGLIRDSKWQKEAGHEVNEDPQDLSGQFFDWLVTATKGDAERYFKVARPGEPAKPGEFRKRVATIFYNNRTEKYKDLPDESIGPGRMGSWVSDHLSARCRKAGITLLTETRARKFLKDDRGRVSSCIADTPEGQLLVTFKACVIAAGGFGANRELLRKYYPEEFSVRKMHSLCPPSLTGDCILAAEEVGAYIDPTIRSLHFPGGFYSDGLGRHPWSISLQALSGTGKAVIINLDGKRWKNEAGMGGDMSAQRDGIACAVVDSEIVEEVNVETDGKGMVMGDSYSNLMEDLEREAAIDDAGAGGRHTTKADTLVELALKMKVDPRALVDTIERYNGFCETGRDLDFGKPARMLKPIHKPPFYAIFGHRWSQSTKGRNGICVNSRFQVLNAEGKVMPGLWAAGDGCTIFGGLVIGTPNGGTDPLTEEQEAARTALSRDVAEAFAPSPATPQGGMPPGGPGGRGGMPIMGGEAPKENILDGEGSPCGGLGPAFLSGFCAGTFAAKYLTEL